MAYVIKSACKKRDFKKCHAAKATCKYVSKTRKYCRKRYNKTRKSKK